MKSLRFFVFVLALGAISAPAMAETTKAAPEPATSAPSGRYLNEVLRTSENHRQTIATMLAGRRGMPVWIRNLLRRGNFVSGQSRKLDLDGKAYEFFSVCEPRTCEVSTLRVLFSPDGKKAWARIGDAKSGETLLGDPEPQMLAPLRQSGL